MGLHRERDPCAGRAKDLRHLAAGLFADPAGRAEGQGLCHQSLSFHQPRAYRELPLPPDLRFDDRRRRGEGCRDDRAPRGQGVHREFLQVRLRRPDAGMGAHRHEGRPRRPHRAGINPYPRGYYKGSGGVPDR